jgi:hypothetical protein
VRKEICISGIKISEKFQPTYEIQFSIKRNEGESFKVNLVLAFANAFMKRGKRWSFFAKPSI